MTSKQIVQMMSLFSDICDISLRFNACKMCKRINNPRKIAERILKDKIDFQCKFCKYTDIISIIIYEEEVSLIKKEMLDMSIKFIVNWNRTDLSENKQLMTLLSHLLSSRKEKLTILANYLLHYHKVHKDISKIIERSDAENKLIVHIREDLDLPIELIKQITGLTRKQIQSLIQKNRKTA